MRPINRIVIHCADTPADMDIGAAEIRRWHVDERGWSDIGYHAVIRRNGNLEVGRPDDRPGAHAAGFNADSLAVCLVGGRGPDGKPENNFTPAQMQTLFLLIANWCAEYGVSDDQIMGHRDLPGVTKACPSFDARKWWAANRGVLS
jgi:N-acetylmuramoyl-L-alanine amidase